MKQLHWTICCLAALTLGCGDSDDVAAGTGERGICDAEQSSLTAARREDAGGADAGDEAADAGEGVSGAGQSAADAAGAVDDAGDGAEDASAILQDSGVVPRDTGVVVLGKRST